MSKTAIHPKYIPTKVPILLGVVLWLFLDRVQAPPVVHGVIWTLYGIIAIGGIACLAQEEWVHPNEVKKT